jgi:hypothetical protein
MRHLKAVLKTQRSLRECVYLEKRAWYALTASNRCMAIWANTVYSHEQLEDTIPK